jgi:hypothetical protein
MGAGIPTTPPVTGDAIAQLMELTRQLLAEQRETNRLLRKEHNPWVDADEAATLLGANVTASGYHKRLLSYCCKKGLLVKFKGDRNRKYNREEVSHLARRVAANEVYLPTTY